MNIPKISICLAALLLTVTVVRGETWTSSDSGASPTPSASAPIQTALGGTNWLEALGVSPSAYSNLVIRLGEVTNAMNKALKLSDDSTAAQALDEAVAAYEDLSNGQLAEIQDALSKQGEAYLAKARKMEADARAASPDNSILYDGLAKKFKSQTDTLQLRASDIQAIRNDIKHNAGRFRERRDYYIALIQSRAGDQLTAAAGELVEALRSVEKEISAALSVPLTPKQS